MMMVGDEVHWGKRKKNEWEIPINYDLILNFSPQQMNPMVAK